MAAGSSVAAARTSGPLAAIIGSERATRQTELQVGRDRNNDRDETEPVLKRDDFAEKRQRQLEQEERRRQVEEEARRQRERERRAEE